MTEPTHTNDPKRWADSKIKRAMVEFLIGDDRFDGLRVEDVKIIAAQAAYEGSRAWSAVSNLEAPAAPIPGGPA